MRVSGLPAVRADEIMNKSIHFIDGMATAAEAVARMRADGTTMLIVEKRSEQDAWGMVVSQDIIRGVIIADRRPEKVHIYEIMAKPIVTVAPDMDLRYVARLMNRVGVRRMPVEEGGQIVGVISQADLILTSSLF